MSLQNAIFTLAFGAKVKVGFARHEQKLPAIHCVSLKYATEIFWGNGVNGKTCLLIFLITNLSCLYILSITRTNCIKDFQSNNLDVLKKINASETDWEGVRRTKQCRSL
jgi:hypothetical protein